VTELGRVPVQKSVKYAENVVMQFCYQERQTVKYDEDVEKTVEYTCTCS